MALPLSIFQSKFPFEELANPEAQSWPTSAPQPAGYQLRYVDPLTEKLPTESRTPEQAVAERKRRYEERKLIRHYDFESGFEERNLVRRYVFGEENTGQEASSSNPWFDTSTTKLYDELRTFAAQGKIERVKDLVTHLVKHRQEAPNPRLYGALILANVDAQNGSAAMVGILLQEMHGEQLEWDSGICHDALRVLAVHPDYLLRAEILEHMRQRWFSLTMAGHHDVTAGLLREQQFELALDRFGIMAGEGVRIQPWLFDMAIYMLNDAGEIDEALRLIKYRVGAGEMGISADVWYHLLDAASSLLHYEAALYVWKKRIQPSYLNPSSGMCLNMLNVAARQGDAQLATDVFRVLGNRNAVFEHQHYELLIDTYINSGDLKTALSVLCVMEAASTSPDEGTTRTLFKYLSKDAHRPMQVFEMLRSLQLSGRTIPTAALNCVIEASLHFRFLEQAIEQYKALHAICAAGPNTATFNVLLRGCVKNKRKDLAMFIASEMLALKVKPDALTYDRLMLVCLSEVDHEDAMLYYYEMKEQGWTPRQGTFSLLVKRAAAAEDARAWEVVADMEKAGFGTAILHMWLKDNWGMEEAEWSSSSQVRRVARPPPVHDFRRPVDLAATQP